MIMKYRKGYLYQLAEDIDFQTNIRPLRSIVTPFITLTLSGHLFIKAGYAWDGASGPTINTDNSMTPSLFHDAIYQLIRRGLLDPIWRETADDAFGEMLKERGMFSLRRKIWVREVKKFGSPGKPKKIYEVE